MLLRQHFMSSMTLGKWKNWTAALGQRWGEVHEQLVRSGSISREPDVQHLLALNNTYDTDKDHVPGLIGKCLRQETYRPVQPASSPPSPQEHDVSVPLLPHEQVIVPVKSSTGGKRLSIPHLVKSSTGKEQELDISDSENDEDSELVAPVLAVEPSRNERELMIARKATRKWYRLAGLDKRTGHEMGYERGEELGVAWTRGICPRVEGRIKMLGEVDNWH